MTKADIVAEINKATGIEKSVIIQILDGSIATIKGSVSKGEPVYLRGFGSFIIKKRAKKTARNIKKGVTITIPEHEIPAFKPSKEFTIIKK